MQFGKQSLFETNNLYAIGDVHGAASKLSNLIKKIEEKDSNPFIVFVGDLLGHGEENLKTLQIISNLKNKYPHQVFVIEGNHDEGLKKYLIRGEHEKLVSSLKGLHSLKELTPKNLLEFLTKEDVINVFEDMIPYFESEKILITHAPIDPSIWVAYGGKRFAEEFEDDDLEFGGILDQMIWELRTHFESSEGASVPGLNKFLICGHQHLIQYPHRTAHKAPRVFKHRAYLDCGCGYRKDSSLFALHFPSKKIFKGK